MNQHFLQSEAWEKFQTDLKRKAVRKHTNYGDFFGIIELGRFNSRLYIPYGPQVQSADNLIKLRISLLFSYSGVSVRIRSSFAQ